MMKSGLMFFTFVFIALNSFSQKNDNSKLVEMINEYRCKNGLNELIISPELSEISKKHCKLLIVENSNFTPDTILVSKNEQKIITANNKIYHSVNKQNKENVIVFENNKRQEDSKIAINAWINSENHNKILLTPTSNKIGVSFESFDGKVILNYCGAIMTINKRIVVAVVNIGE